MEKNVFGKKVLWQQRLLAGFFLLMFIGTIISRIYDSVTIPKVTTAWTKEKAIDTSITGTGTVRERELVFCKVYPGLRIGAVYVASGKQVEEGDVLFSYDQTSMEEEKEKLETQLQKLQIQLEKENISGEFYDTVTEEELAAWELQMAERELLAGQEEFEKKQIWQEEELKRLEQEYEKKRRLTWEELWEQQNQQEEVASQELDLARNSKNSDLKAARRTVEELEEELKQLGEDEAGERELEKKRRELARAKEDLDELQEEWEEKIDNMEREFDWLDSRNERIRSGEISSLAGLLETYENQVMQQEKNMEEEEKKLTELYKKVERAKWELENAVRRDEHEQLSQNQQRRLSQLACQGILLDIEEKKADLEKLSILLEEEGQVKAEQKGTIAQAELLAGKTATGEERLSIARGSFWFEGEFEKDEQKLTMGDEIWIRVPGSSRKIQASITEMNLLGEERGIFRAVLMDEGIFLGSRTGYECQKQSGVYRQVIPLQGLRKDMKGYYCLVAQSKKAILGEEFVARRVDVKLLYKGTTEAAVEGALQSSDPILVGSNQVIGEGDRVRLVESF